MPAPTPRIAHRNAPAYGDQLIVRESTIGLKAAAKQRRWLVNHHPGNRRREDVSPDVSRSLNR
jgi:hypothetical protein